MTHNEYIGQLCAAILTEYRYYDARSLNLAEFLENVSTQQSAPSIYVTGGHWFAEESDVVDNGKVGVYSRRGVIYLSRYKGDIDNDVERLLSALNDPELSDSNRYVNDSISYRITPMEAINEEGEFKFPVVTINIEITQG